ncbi:MAG: S-layer homology domain-containing protein [Armatimonadetes bacterium]|nr:S-layer homology domain-containing protein [Armatimonadota bacterium]
MKILMPILVLGLLLGNHASATEPFKDVPSNHWAAEAVQKLKDKGILKGYPDKTFRGDEPVTRYELAAALVRFAEFLQESQEPLVPNEESKTQQNPDCKNLEKTTPAKVQSPNTTELKNPAKVLIERGFLPKDSALLRSGDKPISCKELADALAWIAKRLIELRVEEVPIEKM